MDPFANRIIGEEQVAPDQLLANPLNFRRHPKAQVQALEGALDGIGWIQRVIVNQRTGHLIDGHARVELAMQRGEPTVPVVYVDLSEDEERTALATFDPLGAMATHDQDILKELLPQVTTDNEALRAMLDGLMETTPADNLYTRKIEPPIYEPKGDKPEAKTLYDTSKTKELLAAIQKAELPDDVRTFLTLAAQRHTVFEYGKIAEFYCHADPEIQALMEDSALVLIDFDKAIESGFVRLSKRMQSLVGKEAGHAG